MTWTTPRTWVSSETLNAALLNEQVRDNLLHQAPQLAKGQRGYFVSTGLNEVARRETKRAVIADSVTTTSTSYTNPSASPGPAVTLNTDTQAVVIFGCDMWQQTSAGSSIFASVAVSGATTTAADDDWSLRKQTDTGDRVSAGQFRWFNTLTPGENTFTMNYKVAAGSGIFLRRRIMAMPL